MKKDVLMPLLALKWNFGNTTLIWVQTAETFWRWYWRMLWWKVRLRDMPMLVRSSRTDTVSGPKERVLQSRWRCIQSANDISDEAPDLGILVDEGYVSDDSVGEDGSEQGDVVNGLFAEYENWERSVESVVVRKQLRRGFEQLFLFGFMRKGWGWLRVNFCLLACFIQLKSIPLYSAADCL